MSDFSRLEQKMDMWSYLGFEPWEHWTPRGVMRGVNRRITLMKSSVLGPIGKYYAWDYIVWLHRDAADIEYLLSGWQHLPEVVTQRFVFVGADRPARKVKGFWLGFRGFLEIYAYAPGGPEKDARKYHPKIRDLVPAIDLAWSVQPENSD
ncbi:MAG: hypothetical protein LBO82_05840 [Synergistaceae bacterium]|jgi:hypothetical protein|nr:hypothetical protein [Synergistaceae bacterium]